ncbi:hypothetical protein ACS5PU_16665 [Pedobacter sp. GSP4]|uniref:hypothetical protein n=1 Tax=Pedobacter sp. GSP4 TaxID=3453716 RepID=UPI003EEB7B33
MMRATSEKSIKALENPSGLKLYHGTTGIVGDKIVVQSNTGVGWNAYTLGNGFYTSVSKDASMLFAHLDYIKKRLNSEEELWPSLDPKLYNIKLKGSTKILDATSVLDASSVRDILERAGVSKSYLNFCKDDQLRSFRNAADILASSFDLVGNEKEHLTKALGYDGLMTLESAWQGWDYYPSGIGVDWESCLLEWESLAPYTVIIYNADQISSFHQIGYSSSEKEDIFEDRAGEIGR